MKKSQFKARLKRAVAWDQVPTLTEEDIDYLVDLSRTPDSNGYVIEDVETWEPSTAYKIGQRVVTANRETFIAVVGGTSGTTAPAYQQDKVGNYVDGTVAWSYQGHTSWTPTYDLNRGAYQGWGLKAAKASSMISFTADGARYDRDQYIANCERMQRKYAITSSVKMRSSPRIVPMILEVKVHD